MVRVLLVDGDDERAGISSDGGVSPPHLAGQAAYVCAFRQLQHQLSRAGLFPVDCEQPYGDVQVIDSYRLRLIPCPDPTLTLALSQTWERGLPIELMRRLLNYSKARRPAVFFARQCR